LLKRNIQILFRLTREEADRFKKRVKKSGLSQEAYLRQLINGLVPTDAPPPDYYAMMRELHAIGNNLNQIAYKANALSVVDAASYEEAAAALDDSIVKITDAVMLPRKLKGSPQSRRLCGEKERPRSDEPFAAHGESDKRRVP